MKPGLQKQLFEKYPKIFSQKDLPRTQTCMCWGIDCGDGWYWLLDMLCETIQSYCDNRNEGVRTRNRVREKGGQEYLTVWENLEDEWQVEASQVKEKYGGLRFYTNGGDDITYGMISFCEHLSNHICELCGTTRDVKVRNNGWSFTLCDKCQEKKGQKKT